MFRCLARFHVDVELVCLAILTKSSYGGGGEKWAQMLHNRPLGGWVDYFTNNPKGNKIPLTDRDAGSFLKQKAKLEIEENEKSLLDGNDFEPISCELALRILRDKYRWEEGVPIVRIAAKLGAIEKVISHELEPGVRNPEGVWGWLGGAKK